MSLGDFIHNNGIVKPVKRMSENSIYPEVPNVEHKKTKIKTEKVYHTCVVGEKTQGFFSRLLNRYLWTPYKDSYIRAKKKGEVKVDFRNGSLSQKTIESIERFNVIDADEIAKGLTKEHAKHLFTLCNEAVNRGEALDPDFSTFIDKINRANSELKKPWTPETLEDWAILDKMEFALTQQYFNFLCEVFNSDEFKGLAFVEEMKDKFGLDWREKMVAEALSRKLAYTENLDGKIVNLPVFDEQTGRYVLQESRITQFPLGENLPAYVIDPIDKKYNPWFAIRGTSSVTAIDENGNELRTGARESLLADTYDPKSIGNKVVKYSMVMSKNVSLDGENVEELTLIDLIEKFDNEGRPLTITGHSLGGNISNIIGIRFFHRINKVYGDDPPAVCKRMRRLWERRLGEAEAANKDNPEEARKLAKRKITNLMCEGSMIPGGGLKVVGLNLAVTPKCYDGKKAILHHHSLNLTTIGSTVAKVDNDAENAKHVRIIMERIRKFGGWILTVFLKFSSHSTTPAWWANHKLVSETMKANKKQYRAYC